MENVGRSYGLYAKGLNRIIQIVSCAKPVQLFNYIFIFSGLSRTAQYHGANRQARAQTTALLRQRRQRGGRAPLKQIRSVDVDVMALVQLTWQDTRVLGITAAYIWTDSHTGWFTTSSKVRMERAHSTPSPTGRYSQGPLPSMACQKLPMFDGCLSCHDLQLGPSYFSRGPSYPHLTKW